MSFILDQKYRQIIPRLNTSVIAKITGELLPINVSVEPKHTAENEIEKRTQLWKSDGTLVDALDLVGSALVQDKGTLAQVTEAAKFAIEKGASLSVLGKSVVESILRQEEITVELSHDKDFLRKSVKRLRKEINFYLFDPFRWIDLAFAYAGLGLNEKAERCVLVALSYADQNRFVIRSASRFFIHMGDPEKALHHIRKVEQGNRDPWLLAAELSIADTFDLKSYWEKQGFRLGEEEHTSMHYSELYGVLGTLEIGNGADKKGKKLLRKALVSTTENTVAQVQWVNQHHGTRIDLPVQPPSFSFEAFTRKYIGEKNYKGALEACKSWFNYQPFSSMPAVLASYLASVPVGDFNQAIEIAKQGLISSPDDFMLKNNLAFSYASQDKVAEAEEVLAAVSESSLSEREKYVYKATLGAIHFRKGQPEQARLLYKEAIEGLKEARDFNSMGLATFFMAKEELKIGSSVAPELVKAVDALAEKFEIDEIKPQLDLMKRVVLITKK